jgi:hypothetical protein
MWLNSLPRKRVCRAVFFKSTVSSGPTIRLSLGGVCVCVCMCCYEAGQQLRVSKICESEMATKDTHLVL